jgi:class 3 adenylate cyclase
MLLQSVLSMLVQCTLFADLLQLSKTAQRVGDSPGASLMGHRISSLKVMCLLRFKLAGYVFIGNSLLISFALQLSPDGFAVACGRCVEQEIERGLEVLYLLF